MSRRLIVITAIFLALFAIFKVTGILLPIENGIRAVTLPVVRGTSSAARGIGSHLRRSPEYKALEERGADLEARLKATVVDYVRLRALEEENRSLRAMLKFQEESGYDFVPARSIARSSDMRRIELVIDKGARDGLEKGMAVVAEEGVFVGTITELNERISYVTLVSDEGSRVAAATAGADELIGVVEGGGNGTAQLTLIPQQTPLGPNDIIVTSGTEEKIPPHLPIGLINTVGGQPTDPFKHASLEPLLKIEKLDLVLILRPSVLRPD